MRIFTKNFRLYLGRNFFNLYSAWNSNPDRVQYRRRRPNGKGRLVSKTKGRYWWGGRRDAALRPSSCSKANSSEQHGQHQFLDRGKRLVIENPKTITRCWHRLFGFLKICVRNWTKIQSTSLLGNRSRQCDTSLVPEVVKNLNPRSLWRKSWL